MAQHIKQNQTFGDFEDQLLSSSKVPIPSACLNINVRTQNEVHVAPSSGQMPEAIADSESSLSKSVVKCENQKPVNNRLQWQKINKGNKAPRIPVQKPNPKPYVRQSVTKLAAVRPEPRKPIQIKNPMNIRQASIQTNPPKPPIQKAQTTRSRVMAQSAKAPALAVRHSTTIDRKNSSCIQRKDSTSSIRSVKRPVSGRDMLRDLEKITSQTNMMNYELPQRPMDYPKIEFKVDCNFPIKILDSMIEIEERLKNGFSVYNRGDNLKKSLINPERVKQYLTSESTSKPKLNFTHSKGQLAEDIEWQMMMAYLKENPTALLDALPTPRGEEEEAKPFQSSSFGDSGPNRPNYPFNRVPSAQSNRSNSVRGTPLKSKELPKAYKPGSSRPTSAQKGLVRQSSVRSVRSASSNRSNQFKPVPQRMTRTAVSFNQQRLQQKQQQLMQQENTRQKMAARAKQTVRPGLLPPVQR